MIATLKLYLLRRRLRAVQRNVAEIRETLGYGHQLLAREVEHEAALKAQLRAMEAFGGRITA